MARALAVSGGSSKGSFAVGVAQGLRDRFGVTFDLVAGTSTGAILAPFVLTNQLDRAEELYTSFSTDDCFVRQDAVTALQTGFLLDTTPLRALLTQFYDAAMFAAVQTAVASGKRLYLAAVNFETKALTYFHVGPPPVIAPGRATRPVTTPAELVDAVLASASQPAIMRLPVIGGQRYCDGGVRETAPVRVVVDNGATEVFAVVLSPDPETAPVAPAPSGLLGAAGRALDLVLTEVVRDDVAEAQEAAATARYVADVRARLAQRLAPNAAAVAAQVFAELAAEYPLAGVRTAAVRVIRPAADLIADSLAFTRADMRRMVRLGLERVPQLFPNGLPPVGGARAPVA